MDPHLALDALKLFVAGYLVLLALAAWAGLHRPLLAYPFRAAYSTFRLLVLAGTFNRVKLVPLSRRARRSTQRRIRNWRFEMQELKDRRAEERGEVVKERSSWSSGATARETAAPAPEPAAPAVPTPVPPTPGVATSTTPAANAPASPFPAAYFDDEDDEDDDLPPTPFFGR